MNKLKIGREYEIKNRVGRYIGIGEYVGIGENTKQYMFRNMVSGQFIFVNEKDLIGVTLK